MVFEVLKVRDRKTLKTYDAVPQFVQVSDLLNDKDPRVVLRCLVGIINYQEFSLVEAIYNMDKLYEKYEVVDTKYVDIDNELIIKASKTVSISASEDTSSDQIDPDLNPNHDPVSYT